jgi:RNA polymerase sigma-70 factor (ECF subfamily)
MNSDMIESRELIERILAGEKRAYGIIVNKHSRLVSHIIGRLVKNREDAEDVCQEVFTRAYVNLRSFQFESKFSTWLAAIAYNTGINYLQRKKIPVVDNEPGNDISVSFSCDDEYERYDISARLQEEIDRLPAMYGVILVLFHLEEMCYQQIAEIMKIPSGTVKSYLFRGRRMLKDRLMMKYRQEDICL